MKYEVTVSPKYPSNYYNRTEYTIEVMANSKSEANKAARRKLESQGHIFDRDDAHTFKAQALT